MSKKIDGIGFKNMVDYAVRNLSQHVRYVNQLNVFPVPDGDTGTNMVTTIHKGLQAVGETIEDLPSVSKKFARSIVLEARGNSGVIVSQFLKGMAERFYDVEVADGALFIEALENGVQYAYSAVATPVEGTMLTVIKDATLAVKREFTGEQSVHEIVDSFICHAKVSLENTPELLAALKENGVVDSGGAGIVYLFEGMKKYLDGDVVDSVETTESTPVVDYDAFNRDSRFDFGYCTEVLLQLLNSKEPFDYDVFKQELMTLGDSLVVSAEGDKVRVHIHTKFPENVLALCHRYGEFLLTKMENMTVQHTEQSKRILCSDVKNNGAFAVVVVANDPVMQALFVEMGADIAICCDENVSTKDYLDAFAKTDAPHILVFPNSSDAVLSAIQAKKLYTKSKITVLNSRSVAECYAALPTIDFEETAIDTVVDAVTEVFHNLLVISVAKRDSSVRCSGREIHHNEYYSFSGKELLVVHRDLRETTVNTICAAIRDHEKEIVTVFYTPSVEEAFLDDVMQAVKDQGFLVEFFAVPLQNSPNLMTISLE